MNYIIAVFLIFFCCIFQESITIISTTFKCFMIIFGVNINTDLCTYRSAHVSFLVFKGLWQLYTLLQAEKKTAHQKMFFCV